VVLEVQGGPNSMGLKVQYNKVEDPKDAYNLVKKNLDPQEWQAFGIEASITCQDRQRLICAEGSGFKLQIKFQQNEADLDLELSLLLKAFKKKIMQMIEQRLGEII
jgi:hypothetical protein